MTNVTSLNTAKEALREMVSRIYHKDIFPETRRAIGIFLLIKIQLKKAQEDVKMAEKPGHYKYITLIEKTLDECIDLADKGEKETTTLSNRFKSIMEKYEHI